MVKKMGWMVNSGMDGIFDVHIYGWQNVPFDDLELMYFGKVIGSCARVPSCCSGRTFTLSS